MFQKPKKLLDPGLFLVVVVSTGLFFCFVQTTLTHGFLWNSFAH